MHSTRNKALGGGSDLVERRPPDYHPRSGGKTGGVYEAAAATWSHQFVYQHYYYLEKHPLRLFGKHERQGQFVEEEG